MARQGKTKITGEDTSEQASRLNQAAASGAAAKAQAHGELLQQHRFGQQQALQTAEVAGGMYDRAQQRKLQERELAFQQQAETGRQALGQQQINLDAAKAGYQQERGGPTSPLLSERQAKLDAEMQRGGEETSALYQGDPAAEQRGAEQQGKPLEMTESGRFVPTEEGRAMQTRKNFEADTERMRAETYREQTRASLLKAQATGDKEAEKAVKTSLMQPIKSDAKLLTQFATGKMNDKDWDSVKSMAQGVPDPELQREIESGIPGPRLRSFLSSKVAHGALNFIKDTGGDLPDGDVIDYTSPQMQQFTQQVAQAGQMIGSMGKDFGAFLGLKTFSDKLRFQNLLASKAVLAGMTAPSVPQQGGAGPFGGMTPSAGQPQQAAAPGPTAPQVAPVGGGAQRQMARHPTASPDRWIGNRQ